MISAHTHTPQIYLVFLSFLSFLASFLPFFFFLFVPVLCSAFSSFSCSYPFPGILILPCHGQVSQNSVTSLDLFLFRNATLNKILLLLIRGDPFYQCIF